MSKSRALHNREERKKNSEPKVYTYGRGARKTTDYGEYALATQRVAYAPSGQTGSMKVQAMKNRKKQQAYEDAFNKRKMDRVR